MYVSISRTMDGIALLLVAALTGVVFPAAFALLSGVLVLIVSSQLEASRLRHELRFYFGDRAEDTGETVIYIWSFLASLVKAGLVAFLAMLTFSGYNSGDQIIIPLDANNAITFYSDRLVIAALLIVGVLWPASFILSKVHVWGRGALRWGFFRLAIPLGLFYSLAEYLLTKIGLLSEVRTDKVIAEFRQVIGLFNDRHPSATEAFEFLAVLNRYSGQFAADTVGALLPPFKPVIEVILTGNLAQGMILTTYVAVIVNFGATELDR